MVKTADIFADKKHIILNPEYIKRVSERTNCSKEIYSDNWFIRITIRLANYYEGVRFGDPTNFETIGNRGIYNDEIMKKQFEETGYKACLIAYFRCSSWRNDYRCATKFPATEDGFNTACHWLDNKRSMILDRLNDWLDSVT